MNRTLTASYAVKRAVIRTLKDQALDGRPLQGVLVTYAKPGNKATDLCVYGGGVRFTQEDAAADGKRRLTKETITVGLYIRVVVDDQIDDVEVADAEVERIGDLIAEVLGDGRSIAGAGTVARVSNGLGDYSQPDGRVIATCAVAVEVTAYIEQ